MDRAQTTKSESLHGVVDDKIWQANRFITMNSVYKKQLTEFSNQIKHREPNIEHRKQFWFSKPDIEKKPKDVFTTGATLNPITHRSAYRTISIKDAGSNLPLIPDLRYKNLTSVFGEKPDQKQLADDSKSATTDDHITSITNPPSRFRHALTDNAPVHH